MFSVGTNTILVPMYVSEIAPLNLRGALGTVNQLAVTIGLLVSQILGIQQLLGTQDGWPTLLGMCTRKFYYLFLSAMRDIFESVNRKFAIFIKVMMTSQPKKKSSVTLA